MVRELVQLAPTDAQKAQHFRDAADMLAAHRAADYPRRWSEMGVYPVRACFVDVMKLLW